MRSQLPDLGSQYSSGRCDIPSLALPAASRSMEVKPLLEGPVRGDEHQEHREKLQPSNEHQESQHKTCRGGEPVYERCRWSRLIQSGPHIPKGPDDTAERGYKIRAESSHN